jgi:hypothetical protein
VQTLGRAKRRPLTSVGVPASDDTAHHPAYHCPTASRSCPSREGRRRARSKAVVAPRVAAKPAHLFGWRSRFRGPSSMRKACVRGAVQLPWSCRKAPATPARFHPAVARPPWPHAVSEDATDGPRSSAGTYAELVTYPTTCSRSRPILTFHPFPRLQQSCYDYPMNDSVGDRAASHFRFAPPSPRGAGLERARRSPAGAIP